MQNEKQPPRICRNCGRISDYDFSRRYCPVTAQVICAGRIAESCKFFLFKTKKETERCSSRE